jgi:hypothetical protein
MRPDATAPAAHGYSQRKGDNKVWRHFGRNPSGRGSFGRFRCLSSLADAGYVSLMLVKKWLLEPGQSSSRRCRPNSLNLVCRGMLGVDSTNLWNCRFEIETHG